MAYSVELDEFGLRDYIVRILIQHFDSEVKHTLGRVPVSCNRRVLVGLEAVCEPLQRDLVGPA
jgi:hypothetical protein